MLEHPEIYAQQTKHLPTARRRAELPSRNMMHCFIKFIFFPAVTWEAKGKNNLELEQPSS